MLFGEADRFVHHVARHRDRLWPHATRQPSPCIPYMVCNRCNAPKITKPRQRPPGDAVTRYESCRS